MSANPSQLNTSRLGESVINTTSSSHNPITGFIHNITSSIENDINDDLSSFAKELGIHDWYSVHVLDFCEGYYTPSPLPNATLSSSDIHKNITSCSNRTAFWTFNPADTLQRELNNSGHSNINLTELDWPSAIDDGVKALHVAQKAAFILYCIAIALIAVAVLFALISVFLNGRLSAFLNILLSTLAFFAIGIASALVTTVGVKAADEINKYGSKVGVSASKGGKFLTVTWIATGLMFVTIFVWFAECIVGRGGQSRRWRKREYAEN